MTRTPLLLLGDIGGTNARFMLAPESGKLPAPSTLRTADFPTLEAALARVLGNPPPHLRGAALCVAGPVSDGVVRMTNCPWQVSRAGLAAWTGVGAPLLLNDFTALAHGIPALGPGDLRALGPGDILTAKGPIGVLGPGTGLGVSGLIPTGEGDFVALSGEGGHADLAPANAREMALIGHLLAHHGHVSAEMILSGPGLETLYTALAAIDGAGPQNPSAAEIDARALAGEARAKETIALFTGFLGAVAGNLALILGASGGVYLGGGILPRWGALLDPGLFRARFEAKGRFAAYLACIPTALITAPDAAFRGLRRLALKR